MVTCRIGIGLAVVNRLLYVVGGYDGESRLATVECYHPENNDWHFVAPMSVTRSGAGELSLSSQYIEALVTYASYSPPLGTILSCDMWAPGL